MTRIFKLTIIVLMGGLLFACTDGKHRKVERYTIEQMMNTTTIFGSDFSKDVSKILFTSDKSGVFNAYEIPIEGGDAQQLTHSDSSAIYAISYCPNDNRLLFQSDKDGNEIWNIYIRDTDGSVRNLTPSAEARSTFMRWSEDGNSFYYMSNRRDPRFFDVYEMNINSFEEEMIYENNEGYSPGPISNNKRYIAFGRTITTNNSDMYLYDTQTGKMSYLSEHEGDIVFNPVTFSSDSKELYYLTNEGREFTYLKKYIIESAEMKVVEKTNWDILYSYFSRNGTYRVVGINNDAKTEVRIYENASGEEIALPELPNADITSIKISPDEAYMTFYVNGDRSPNNLYVYSFANGEFKRLTNSMNPEIDPEHLAKSKVIRYESFDGLEIPAILYKPASIAEGDKAPALVWVHGGPGGQSRIGYNPLLQYLANHGYVVLAVNNRGSSGYGKTFFGLDDLKHGQDDLQDCIEAKKFLAATGYADHERIGIIGGSYGGYMVLAALAFQPEEFQIGIDIFGVSNWLRTLRSIPPYWESFREALYKELGNPETDEEYLRSISPLFHAEKIKRPLMVLQGANDPRVLKVESDEIVEKVKANNVPVEYIVFDDEGHGFRKKENRIRGYKAILDFADRYLKDEVE